MHPNLRDPRFHHKGFDRLPMAVPRNILFLPIIVHGTRAGDGQLAGAVQCPCDGTAALAAGVTMVFRRVDENVSGINRIISSDFFHINIRAKIRQLHGKKCSQPA